MNYKFFRLMQKQFHLFLILLGLALGLCGAVSADTVSGQKIFEKNCMACHSLGTGRGVGPDLKGITDKRDAEWLKQAILNFPELKNSGDELAMRIAAEYAPTLMPSQQLSPSQLNDLMDFLKHQTKIAKQDLIDKGLPRKFTETDISAGRNLFLGKKVFRNGAINCFACHSVKGEGLLGGGSLGPDLTNTWNKFGEKGLIGVLQNPAFPTMKKLYENNPIAEDEIIALLAFFESVNSRKPFNYTPWFVGVAALILAMALGGMNYLYRNRFKNVRSKMVEGSKK